MRRIPVPNDIIFRKLQSYLNKKGFKHTAGNPPHYVYTYDKDGIKEVVRIAQPHGTSEGVKPQYIRNVINSIERIGLWESND